MLTTLRVKNLALVENIRVAFEPGLNIITGETGAGKSIMMGALNLLLGARADRALIRAGEDACGAEALFELKDASAIDALLEECGLDPCPDGQLVIRRIVKASGSNQNLVNDSPVTLQVLKQIGELLVDMHGPHDHQSLLDVEAQLEILDAFGHLWDDREPYEAAYATLRATEKRLDDLQGDDTDVTQQVDFLSFRINEIEKSEIRAGEEDEVRNEHEVLGNAQRIQELAGAVVNALCEGEGCAFDTLTQVHRGMDELARLMPEAAGWRERMDALTSEMQELHTDITRMVEGIDGSPVRLEWLDNRLATYQQLKRKYGGSVESILQTLEESKERLHDLETRSERIAELEKETAELKSETEKHGRELRKKRKSVAKKLGKAIEDELQALGLADSAFSVAFAETELRPSGMDEIDFEFAPNVGEPPRPLRAIASSGEISRVMLAIKTVLADHDRIPVLVFDEIDTNIGGETGSAVGRKMAEVAERHQVICITHLPQVAVFGNTHFAVAKYVKDGRTFSSVERLEDENRVEEVARMLGGKELTSMTMDHAREMLEG